MSATATAFTLDDITLEYSQEDYKPQHWEPKTGVWFEFAISRAVCEQSKQGHLQVKLEAEALDSSGKAMFKKFINVPMPVSIGENAAPTYAKGLWLMNIVSLFPENLAYDRIEKDPITGKMAYFKGDVHLKGDEYDRAMTKQNKTVGEKAREVAKEWVKHGDGVNIDEFMGKRFFARLVRSKDGKYVNIDRPYAIMPTTGEEVCYDKKEAQAV